MKNLSKNIFFDFPKKFLADQLNKSLHISKKKTSKYKNATSFKYLERN